MSTNHIISRIKFQVFQETVTWMENFRDFRNYIVSGFICLQHLGIRLIQTRDAVNDLQTALLGFAGRLNNLPLFCTPVVEALCILCK